MHFNLGLVNRGLYNSCSAKVRPTRNKKMQYFTRFLCAIHDSASLVIEACQPRSPHEFRVRCKQCEGRFIGWANESQVKDLLELDPGIETKRYVKPDDTEFKNRFG